MTHGDLPAPEDLDEREVFAFFGLASYLASCLEEQLSSFAAMLHLLRRTAVNREIVTRLFDEMESHTLGRLLREARQLTTFPNEVDQLLRDALRERNVLIHHFFREHAANFMLQPGRKLMIDQLRHMSSIFQRANAAIEAIQTPLAVKFGMTAEALAKVRNEMLAAATREHGA